MSPVAAMALAAGLAAALDAILFNPLTVRRTRAHAVRVDPRAPKTFRATLGLGLPVQLLALVPRRAWSYALHHALAAWLMVWVGMRPVAASAIAGAVAGGSEGLVFAPTRRLMATQQAYLGKQPSLWMLAQAIVYREGWLGLWHGCGTNALRTALGGAAWFAGIALGQAVLPHAGALVHGIAGSVVNTLVVNPFEVALMRAYAPASVTKPATFDGLQGIAWSLARTVPSSAVGYWLTMALYARMVAH